MRIHWRRSSSAVALLCLLAFPPRATAALVGVDHLSAVYDQILAARFDDADAELTRACPPAPAEACTSLEAVSLWWQIQINPESRLLDERFNEAASAAIAASEAWTRREPRRGEAWFYLAGSYAPLVQWHVLRGERVSAAREANRIREALERALALDPSIDDAYFGIGLYHYYADVAPAAAKMLRWLLFLPGGDRAKGLEEMQTARRNGELLQGEADYQLHLVYLWYEHDPRQALALLGELDRRYPTNPLFLQLIARTDDTYLHDLPASAAAWQALLDRALGGRLAAHVRGAEVRARLGLAAMLDQMAETDRAVDQLKAVLASNPTDPPGARGRAALQLGQAYDRLGARDLAVPAYRTALAAAASDDVRARARAALAAAPDARATEPYRLSIAGWRAFERGALADADADLGRAAALAPGDPVTRLRYARVLEARGDRARARDAFERVVAAHPPAPAFVLGTAYVEYAHLLERSGERDRALAMFRHALDVAGADPRAHDDAASSVRRLGGARAKSEITNF
jgi:tetratricopeptide (TPR) repeat protein